MKSKKKIRKLETPKGKKVPPVWLYPTGIEREYHRDLTSLVRELKKQINILIIPNLPLMIEEVESRTPNDRADDFLSRLNALIFIISKSIKPKLDETILESFIVGEQINRFNREQFLKISRSIFGIDIFQGEPWLHDQLTLFASQNASLIKSLPEQEFSRVQSIIERGLQEGKSYSELTKEIKKSFAISDRRAKLIARDQTKKLNSSLTKLRQQELGVEEYVWQTAGDERVRPTHKANDGKIFRWDTPPKVTGHPGNDVNCRCVARPVLDKLLNLR